MIGFILIKTSKSFRDTNKIYGSLEAIVSNTKITSKTIFLKLNADQIDFNLLSIYLVSFVIEP